MKQESTEENSVYMGSAMENKGIMYVLASKPYHEVKEPGYRTVMIGQDLPEEYEEKKDDSGRPETGRSDRKKKKIATATSLQRNISGSAALTDILWMQAGFFP